MGKKDTFYKPHEFGKLKALFVPNLLNLTLWMAIASFAFTFVAIIKPENITWVLNKMGIEQVPETLVNWAYFIIFAGAFIVFIFACIIVAIMVSTWLITNVARYINYKRHKTIQINTIPEKVLPQTKIDICIESNQPIENAINKLIEKLK